MSESSTQQRLKLNRVGPGYSAVLLMLAWAVAIPSVSQSTKTRNDSLLTPQVGAKLLQSINLGQPEMLHIREAVGKGDQTEALTRLAEYYRSRSSVNWNPDIFTSAISPQSRAVADAAAQGRLQGGTVALTYSFPSGRVDWHFDATAHVSGHAENNEWQWQLNRMAFWSDLARAYHATGDERYAQAFVGQLRSWIRQCPPPDHMDNAPGSTWRTIDTGIRTSGAWMDAFYAFRKSSSVTDDDLLAMVNAFLEQGVYLRRFHTKLNWLTMEMAGLYAVGAEFPEFKDASDWRHFAADTLDQEAQRQFLPDGAQEELSSSYQQVAIDSTLRIVDISRWTDRQSELPSGYVDQLKKAFQYQVDIAAPDRQLPKINDSWSVSLPPIIRKALNYYPNPPEFQWLATDGKQGNPPPFTSTFLNRSGIVVMRSDWSKSANYLLFRAGPLGMGHQQQEALDVQMWAYGREMMSNGGGGNYEKSKWREYGTSAYSHSTVVIDGLAENEALNQNDPEHDPNQKSQGPIDVGWQSNSVFDFAAKDYNQGYGPSHLQIAREHREVLFVKPDVFIVADRLFPTDSRSHQYQARWQLLTTRTHLDVSTGILQTEDIDVSNSVVVPLLPRGLQVKAVSAQEQPELLGWEIRTNADPEVVPATTLLHTISATGPQLILTMFLPLRANEDNPVARVEPGSDGVSATAVFKNGRRIFVDCSGSSGIKIRETLADGSKGPSIDTGSR